MDVKQDIIAQAVARLAALGVPAVCGQGADISVAATFIDAAWRGGRKKITFEASVALDEARGAVFMWQKTSESSAGFSFGFSGESYRQQGAKLYRKVKAVQYGPDGKAYEYELDLGAITRAVEEAATGHGWRFEVVMERARASYPPGFVPAAGAGASFCAACGAPLSGKFCGRCGRASS